MNGVSLDSGHREPSDSDGTEGGACPPSDRLITATKWCAIIVGVLQLLFVGVHCWIVLDLHFAGARMTLFAFAFATALVVQQLAILYFGWKLPRSGRKNLRVLAALYVLGLAVLAVFHLTNIDLKTWMVRPGAVLPPNEIMGHEWPLALAMIEFGLAQLLGMVPLVLVIFALVRRSQSIGSVK